MQIETTGEVLLLGLPRCHIIKHICFCPRFTLSLPKRKQQMDSEKINRLIAENNLEKALAYIDEWLSNHSKDDKAYYLKGLVFWKQGNWKLTIENYLKAIEINPNSPAKQAYEMVMDIINFSNPDLYNP